MEESAIVGKDNGPTRKRRRVDDRVFFPCSFKEATKHRSFKLVVEGKSLFVNAHFLADLSSFFDALCFGDFKEGKEGEAELKDAERSDVVEMLHVLGADTRNENKKIDMYNCLPMLYLADIWDIGVLRKKCISFLDFEFPKYETSLDTTLKYLFGCEECGVPVRILQLIASRLASFGQRLLHDQDICSMIEDKMLCCAIFAAAPNVPMAQLAHIVGISRPGEECFLVGCNTSGSKCRACEHTVCSDHREICPTMASQFETLSIVKVDECFFVEKPRNAKFIDVPDH